MKAPTSDKRAATEKLRAILEELERQGSDEQRRPLGIAPHRSAFSLSSTM